VRKEREKGEKEQLTEKDLPMLAGVRKEGTSIHLLKKRRPPKSYAKKKRAEEIFIAVPRGKYRAGSEMGVLLKKKKGKGGATNPISIKKKKWRGEEGESNLIFSSYVRKKGIGGPT